MICVSVVRPQWNNQAEFILTIVGYAVGLGMMCAVCTYVDEGIYGRRT